MNYRNYTFDDYYKETKNIKKYYLYKFKGLKTPQEDVGQELDILLWKNVDKLNKMEKYIQYYRQMLYYTLLQILIKEHKNGLWVTDSLYVKGENGEDINRLDINEYKTDFLYEFEDPFLTELKRRKKIRDKERYERIKNDPEYIRKRKEYLSRPEVKEHMKEQRREYYREYYNRPGKKEHRREYQREYYKRKKLK